MEIFKLKKNKFYLNKAHIFLKDVDTEKVLVSNTISISEKKYKYFIGYFDNNNNNKVKLLPIMLLKRSSYVKSCGGQTKWMYFLIEDDDLLEK